MSCSLASYILTVFLNIISYSESVFSKYLMRTSLLLGAAVLVGLGGFVYQNYRRRSRKILVVCDYINEPALICSVDLKRAYYEVLFDAHDIGW